MTNIASPKGWSLAGRGWGKTRDRKRDARDGAVLGVLIWNSESHEGEVLLHPSFGKKDWVDRGDALTDWTGLLAREHNPADEAEAGACDEGGRLRSAWLRALQDENGCERTGRPCREPERCGCALEQEGLIAHAERMTAPQT